MVSSVSADKELRRVARLERSKSRTRCRSCSAVTMRAGTSSTSPAFAVTAVGGEGSCQTSNRPTNPTLTATSSSAATVWSLRLEGDWIGPRHSVDAPDEEDAGEQATVDTGTDPVAEESNQSILAGLVDALF